MRSSSGRTRVTIERMVVITSSRSSGSAMPLTISTTFVPNDALDRTEALLRLAWVSSMLRSFANSTGRAFDGVRFATVTS